MYQEDPIVPLAHSEIARQIPRAKVQIFECCGHMPQYEHFDAFNQAVIAFLHESSSGNLPDSDQVGSLNSEGYFVSRREAQDE